MKTALVTGISKGIGKAICEQLITEGYFVHGTYNTGKKQAEELKQKHKGNLQIYQADFSKREQTLNLVEKLKQFKFDAIVNNAGIFVLNKFKEFDIKKWDKVMEVNLNTPLLISVGLKDNLNKNASIVNISSTDGYQGSFAGMSYSASKAAIINLTKSLGNNFGPSGIRVNSVAPGWVNTNMDTDVIDDAVEITPLGRNGKPEEIANFVSFLLSDKATFSNGATYVVDGGYTNVDKLMKDEAEL